MYSFWMKRGSSKAFEMLKGNFNSWEKGGEK
jgi:hypothetical protein